MSDEQATTADGAFGAAEPDRSLLPRRSSSSGTSRSTIRPTSASFSSGSGAKRKKRNQT